MNELDLGSVEAATHEEGDMQRRQRWLVGIGGTLALTSWMGCARPAEPEAATTPPSAAVDTARLIDADAEPGSWMSYGRTYSEQRYSPLDQIGEHNVGELGLAWSFDLETRRGIEATSIVVDGVMYTTSAPGPSSMPSTPARAQSSGPTIRTSPRRSRSTPAATS